MNKNEKTEIPLIGKFAEKIKVILLWIILIWFVMVFIDSFINAVMPGISSQNLLTTIFLLAISTVIIVKLQKKLNVPNLFKKK